MQQKGLLMCLLVPHRLDAADDAHHEEADNEMR
jgi:hypothetical protein